MSDLLVDIQENICELTLNRVNKNNAFDDKLIQALCNAYLDAIQSSKVRVILLKSNGKHFSAGADLEWMQRMAQFDVEENTDDALLLAQLMHTIYHCPKPTITMIQGSAIGGGIGLIAASDVGIAALNASFCFSEVQLGLIPAVISPFIVKAIGERATKALFMSAEVFDAPRALTLNLIHHCVPEEKLLEFTLNYAKKCCNNAPNSVVEAKILVSAVANRPIDIEMANYTAKLIAHKRGSAEGQNGIKAFLNKVKPNWN
ncbi:MAG: enoyl-CoA hydratase/isomerase family protein [Legionella sp.]|nr:enoyl-CoA hydratase/isomerase family protein [Legionella sp.]